MIDLQEHVTILHQLLLDFIMKNKEMDDVMAQVIDGIFTRFQEIEEKICKLESASEKPLELEVELRVKESDKNNPSGSLSFEIE